MLSPLPSHPASAACSNKKRNDRYMFSRGWMRGPIRMPDVAQFIVWSEWWHRLLPRPSRSTTSSSDLCASSFSRISLRRLTAQSALCSRISSASFCVYFFPPLLSTAKPPPCGNERQNHASFRRVPPFALPSHAPPTHFTLTKIETRIHATRCRRKQTISPGSQSEIGQGLKASSSPCPRQSWPLPRPFVEAQ